MKRSRFLSAAALAALVVNLPAQAFAGGPFVPISVYGDTLSNGTVKSTPQEVNGGSFTGGMSINSHRTHRTWGAVNIVPVFHWYWNVGNGEQTMPNDGRIAEVMELPSGSGKFYRVTLNGEWPWQAEPNVTYFADVIPVYIAPNTYFTFHTGVHVIPTGLLPVGQGSQSVFPSGTWVRGTNDYQEYGGTGLHGIETSDSDAYEWNGSYSYGPVAVFGTPVNAPTHLPVVGLVGASWMRGGADIAQGGAYARALEAASIPFIRLACGGEAAWAFAQPKLRANRMQLLKFCTSVFFDYGPNDIPSEPFYQSVFNQIKVNVLTSMQAASSFGAVVFPMTYNPRANSSNPAIFADQVPMAQYNVYRQQFNAYFRSANFRTDLRSYNVKAGALTEIGAAVETDSTNRVPQRGVILANADRWYVPPAGQPLITNDFHHPTTYGHETCLQPIIPIGAVV